jgi:hypothetical protein
LPHQPAFDRRFRLADPVEINHEVKLIVTGGDVIDLQTGSIALPPSTPALAIAGPPSVGGEHEPTLVNWSDAGARRRKQLPYHVRQWRIRQYGNDTPGRPPPWIVVRGKDRLTRSDAVYGKTIRELSCY